MSSTLNLSSRYHLNFNKKLCNYPSFHSLSVNYQISMKSSVLCILLLGLSTSWGSPTKNYVKSPPERIVGGVPANRGEFPWLVELQVGSGIGRHHCGGVLINADHVITAAHCVSGSQSYSVIAGEHNLNTDEGSEQSKLVSEVVIHPDYSSVTFENDIAILKLASPFTVNFYVRAAILPLPGDEVTGNLTVAGWGATSEGGVLPDTLYKVDVPFVDKESCNNSYNGDIYDSMICAGTGGKDSCQGDSGGPLQNGSGVVFGLVSWGIGCGRQGYPGVYASIPHLARWITLNT